MVAGSMGPSGKLPSGDDPDLIATKAAGAGYDVAPVRALIDMLAARHGA